VREQWLAGMLAGMLATRPRGMDSAPLPREKDSRGGGTFVMEDKPMHRVQYDQLRGVVFNGDMLLWRPVNLAGRVIALGTSLRYRKRIVHSHASMAAWGANGRLYSLELIQWHGGRHLHLSDELKRYPYSCEVWKPEDKSFCREGAVRQMLWLMGQHYGWRNFLHITVRMLFPHFLLPTPKNSDDPDQPLVCSSAYSWAARTGGGVAPCPQLQDHDVSPADLALSKFAKYYATPVV